MPYCRPTCRIGGCTTYAALSRPASRGLKSICPSLKRCASGSFAGIVGVYQKHEFSQEKRQALDAWGAFVAGFANNEASKKVVRRRKAQ